MLNRVEEQQVPLVLPCLHVFLFGIGRRRICHEQLLLAGFRDENIFLEFHNFPSMLALNSDQIYLFEVIE